MRWQYISGIVAIFLLIFSLAMALPLAVSLYYRDTGHGALLWSIALTALAGVVLKQLARYRQDYTIFINQKEGMAVVALTWTAMGLFGALPFYFSPDFTSFTDAVFESVSGFTTTGASVMTDIQGAAPSLLFWRSLIQWMGGMGIIVLSLAILPFLGVGGIQLYKAEVPSPVPDKLTPRLSDSAKILWMVYAGMTLVEIIFLALGGMPLFESICHGLTTLPTGGFSPKNASIAHYDSAYFDSVILFSMLLAGINFSLHYQMLRGRPLAFWKDTECRWFLGITLMFILVMAANIHGTVYESVADTFRYASFQVVSILTTTGYATADYEAFPPLSQMILFICMIIGGSAGSTGGGIKVARLIVCCKYCFREFFKLIHPRIVRHIKLNQSVVSEEVIRSIMGFLCLYALLFLASAMTLASMGLDMITCFGAVAACISNIGPGFGTVGPTENFAHLPALAKWILSWCMLLGRLEIYTVIILLVPEFWK